jgi:hypothetical protein
MIRNISYNVTLALSSKSLRVIHNEAQNIWASGAGMVYLGRVR